MTQMMLFDTSAQPSLSLATPQALATTQGGASAVASPAPVATPARQRPAKPLPAERSAAAGAAGDGVQQIGDLARLVLLRYELLARRREEMARRTATR